MVMRTMHMHIIMDTRSVQLIMDMMMLIIVMMIRGVMSMKVILMV